MERMAKPFVRGLLAACLLVGAAPTARSQGLLELVLPHEVSVSGVAFGDDAGSEHCRVAKGGYAYIRPDPQAVEDDCDLVAPIQLPDGARLASLTCSLYDAEAANAMEAHLVREDLRTGDLAPVFTTAGTVDSGAIQVLTDTTAAAGTARVDNGRYAYYVAAAFSYTDFTTTGNAMRVYGCTVRVR